MVDMLEKIEDAISKVEARVVIFLTLFFGFLFALANGYISSEQFMTLMAMDGLLAEVLKKI